MKITPTLRTIWLGLALAAGLLLPADGRSTEPPSASARTAGYFRAISSQPPLLWAFLKVRYLYQVLRGLPKEVVFAQMLAGFTLANTDSRVVGLNLVMPEDEALGLLRQTWIKAPRPGCNGIWRMNLPGSSASFDQLGSMPLPLSSPSA